MRPCMLLTGSKRLLLACVVVLGCAGPARGQTGITRSQASEAFVNLFQGTVTTSTQPNINSTVTWNGGGVTFKGWRFVITDTASAAGSLPIEILGGAAGTTSLFSLSKAGAATFGSTVTATGATLTGGLTGTTAEFSGAVTVASCTGCGGAAGGSDTQVQFNDGGTALGADAGLTYDKTLDVLTQTRAGVGSTSSDGVVLSNTTAAANGAQQWSPRLRLAGNGWKTDGGGASQSVAFIQEIVPVQGTAAPMGRIHWRSAIGGGAYTDLMFLDSNAQLLVYGGITTNGNSSVGGAVIVTGSISAGAVQSISWAGRTLGESPLNGVMAWKQNNGATGIRFQFTSAPTISSGFGTTPTITTGSTDTAGSVNVGTGGTASQGVIAFAAAWVSAPFCVATVATSTAGDIRAIGVVTTTAQLTITAASAWAASSIVTWHCIGASS